MDAAPCNECHRGAKIFSMAWLGPVIAITASSVGIRVRPLDFKADRLEGGVCQVCHRQIQVTHPRFA